MSIDRTIIIRDEQLYASAAAVLSANWRAMAAENRPMAVRIYEHLDKRSIESNALMWVLLSDISAQAWVGGRQYPAEIWHEHAKREFLPDESGPTNRCRKGYRKWDILPSGERVLAGSTTQLTTAGMAEYLTKIEAFGATEMGVRFNVSPGDYR